MGCATSKPKVCESCQARLPKGTRSYSLHAQHAPESRRHHMVDLTSSTLGALKLDRSNTTHNSFPEDEETKKNIIISREDVVKRVLEAKSWSRMIEEKIPKDGPKTPTETPTGEPETINAWELMEGLEDSSPIGIDPNSVTNMIPRNAISTTDSNFVTNMISTLRKELEELPPANPFHLKPLLSETEQAEAKRLKGDKEKLILYFTSLRGVRKTYEDCCHVRVILKGLGIKVDERDLSLHSGFKDELKQLMGEKGYPRGGLPKVFIGRKYIGGAAEIRRMNESGQLEKVLGACERDDDGGGGGGGNGGVCEACGDVRFVPCCTCSGSCKVYYENDDGDDDQFDEDDGDDDQYGFQRCPDCNENGLIRCPICCK